MTIAQALDPSSDSPFLDRSPRMRALRTGIDNVADTDATVLIRGDGDRGRGDPPSHRVRRALLGAEIPRCRGGFSEIGRCAAREAEREALLGHDELQRHDQPDGQLHPPGHAQRHRTAQRR